MEIQEEYIVGIIQNSKFYGEHLSDILLLREKITVREFIYDYLNDDDDEEGSGPEDATGSAEKTKEEMTLIPEEGTSIGIFKDGKMYGYPIGGSRAEKYNDMLLTEFIEAKMSEKTEDKSRMKNKNERRFSRRKKRSGNA